MLQTYVDRFISKRESLETDLISKPPKDYADLVTRLVSAISDNSDYSAPDPERITVIDHGAYQVTLVFIIGATGYQPSNYWSIKVSYGSCSGCDTFEAIRSYENTCTPKQAHEYGILMLHMIQGMKEL